MNEQQNIIEGTELIKAKINTDSKKCECGFLSKDTAKYCAHCGYEFKEEMIEESEEEKAIKFCDQCGNQLSEKAAFCSKCGNAIYEENKETDRNIITKEKTIKDLVKRFDFEKVKNLVKIFSVISIICFFMPFVTERAMGFRLSLNGFETAFGMTFGSGTASMVDSADLKMNIFILFSVISCVVAAINAFQKGNVMKSVAGLNIASVICLFLYIVTYNLYYEYDEWNVLMSIEYGVAPWALIIINVIVSILSWSIGTISCENEDVYTQ